MTKRAQTNGTIITSKIDPKRTLKTTPAAEDGPKAPPEGAKRRPQNRPKQPPEEPPESIGSNGQKKEAGPPGFDKAPGGSNVTFSTVFSLPEHPPGSPVLGPTATILGPDLVPVTLNPKPFRV